MGLTTTRRDGFATRLQESVDLDHCDVGAYHGGLRRPHPFPPNHPTTPSENRDGTRNRQMLSIA